MSLSFKFGFRREKERILRVSTIFPHINTNSLVCVAWRSQERHIRGGWSHWGSCKLWLWFEKSLTLCCSGGAEAELYIPRAILLLTHVSACRAWETAWRKAPLHVYLPWVPQMLSLMGTTDGDPLIPCLEVRSLFHHICHKKEKKMSMLMMVVRRMMVPLRVMTTWRRWRWRWVIGFFFNLILLIYSNLD